MSNTDAVLLAVQARLREMRDERDRLRAEIEPLLLGRRVRLLGHVYQITQVNCWRFEISGYGVRVSKTGKVGTRGYAIEIDPTKLLEEDS